MKLNPVTLALWLAAAPVIAAEPTVEQQLAELRAKIEALEAQTQAQEQALESTATALEQQSSAASAVHIGGYGELHYNRLSGEGGAADKSEVDFHRFVLFFGYDFNDSVRLVTELELEHALSSSSAKGEVELEQAYVEFDVAADHKLRTGVMLVPIGFINETHEPPAFYGVERNPVENAIIPTTWWEAGVAATGNLAPGLKYDLLASTGLNTNTDKNYAVRSGRQKASFASAEAGALTAGLRYTAIPGVELGGAVQYQQDVTQQQDTAAGDAWLAEAHAAWQIGAFQLKALAANWQLEGDGPEAKGADQQQGWYLEPSYKLTEQWGFFARYNDWDNKAGASGDDSGKNQIDAGVNYWPIKQVVLKADYQWQDHDDGKNQNGFNFGVGYVF